MQNKVNLSLKKCGVIKHVELENRALAKIGSEPFTLALTTCDGCVTDPSPFSHNCKKLRFVCRNKMFPSSSRIIGFFQFQYRFPIAEEETGSVRALYVYVHIFHNI